MSDRRNSPILFLDNTAVAATSRVNMSTTTPSDAADVRLVLEGDRKAYGRLYDRHARGVRAVVAAVSSDFTAVEDLTQEAFLRGYRRLASLKNPDAFGPWIQGVARMVARERRRQLRRDRLRFAGDEGDVAVADETGAAIENDEEQRRVLAAVAELPDRERLVLHAYFFHEQGADQAAAAIGISRSGFYTVLERGMTRLRKRLGVTLTSPSKTRAKR